MFGAASSVVLVGFKEVMRTTRRHFRQAGLFLSPVHFTFDGIISIIYQASRPP
jgi:hypothetical protein